ncbi:trehalose-6-phosphate synthase [Sphingobacterium sp. E70]|nr:trehalose-6-phosphate synthase [Sphingobacterium sp. E70]ULT24701.1 trehalose-6-phosphate synthase [Sphingobacterium sp. E70]
MNLLPVFLSKEEIHNFYEGYSNEVLWPICHYQPSYIHFDREYWSTYVAVNKNFVMLRFRHRILPILSGYRIISSCCCHNYYVKKIRNSILAIFIISPSLQRSYL